MKTDSMSNIIYIPWSNVYLFNGVEIRSNNVVQNPGILSNILVHKMFSVYHFGSLANLYTIQDTRLYLLEHMNTKKLKLIAIPPQVYILLQQ